MVDVDPQVNLEREGAVSLVYSWAVVLVEGEGESGTADLPSDYISPAFQQFHSTDTVRRATKGIDTEKNLLELTQNPEIPDMVQVTYTAASYSKQYAPTTDTILLKDGVVEAAEHTAPGEAPMTLSNEAATAILRSLVARGVV